MKTIKRKNRSNKRRKMFTRNKTSKSRKTMRGGERDDDEPPRKSRRIQQQKPASLSPSSLDVQTYPLGGESSRTNFSDKTILQFIHDSIEPNVPVTISLPIPPERHAFLVLVSTKNKQIMVADWGKRNLDDLENFDNWIIYVKFMKFLKEKYPSYDLHFFDVDKELYQKANAHHKKGKGKGSGGCSYYIYKWIQKHNDELLENMQ
jgi:hypothetical protein